MRRSTVKPFVLALTPFGESFNDIYRLGIKEACERAGAYCERVDEQIFDGSIVEQIYTQIAEADVIVADMTGRNPNVFYEVGYARAMDKQIVLLTQSADDIPFDVRQYPHVVYGGNVETLKERLEQKIRWFLQNPKGKAIEVLEAKKSFPQQLVRSVRKARQFVLDTNLMEEIPRELNNPHKRYRQILEQRLSKGELSFKRVEVVYTRERLERIIGRLLRHEGQECFIRHYDAPDKAVPVLQVMSFDDKEFYLGGFHSDIPPAEEQVICVREARVARFLRDYWNVLWMKAVPLNEGDSINWKEIKRIALRIGMTEADLDEMIGRLREQVIR